MGTCHYEGNLLIDDETGAVLDEILTDADNDRYFVDVQNGNGYYNEDGKFVRYRTEE